MSTTPSPASTPSPPSNSTASPPPATSSAPPPATPSAPPPGDTPRATPCHAFGTSPCYAFLASPCYAFRASPCYAFPAAPCDHRASTRYNHPVPASPSDCLLTTTILNSRHPVTPAVLLDNIPSAARNTCREESATAYEHHAFDTICKESTTTWKPCHA